MPGVHREGTLAPLGHTELGWRCLPEEVEGAVPVEAAAGSVVVFSSLTPHRTGPNRTDQVRSAYIVQYLAEGAVTVAGNWLHGEAPGERLPVRRSGASVRGPGQRRAGFLTLGAAQTAASEQPQAFASEV